MCVPSLLRQPIRIVKKAEQDESPNEDKDVQLLLSMGKMSPLDPDQYSYQERRYRGIYEKAGMLVFSTKPIGRWNAQIQHQGKKYYLGSFDTKEEAALEYDRAALKYHGEHAIFNFSRCGSLKEKPFPTLLESTPQTPASDDPSLISALMGIRAMASSPSLPLPDTRERRYNTRHVHIVVTDTKTPAAPSPVRSVKRKKPRRSKPGAEEAKKAKSSTAFLEKAGKATSSLQAMQQSLQQQSMQSLQPSSVASLQSSSVTSLQPSSVTSLQQSMQQSSMASLQQSSLPSMQQPSLPSLQQSKTQSQQQPSLPSQQQPSISSLQQPSLPSLQQPPIQSIQQSKTQSLQQPSQSIPLQQQPPLPSSQQTPPHPPHSPSPPLSPSPQPPAKHADSPLSPYEPVAVATDLPASNPVPTSSLPPVLYAFHCLYPVSDPLSLNRRTGLPTSATRRPPTSPR